MFPFLKFAPLNFGYLYSGKYKLWLPFVSGPNFYSRREKVFSRKFRASSLYIKKNKISGLLLEKYFHSPEKFSGLFWKVFPFLRCLYFLAQSIKFLLTEKDKDFSFAWIIESLICGQNLDNIGLYEMCNV